VSQSVIHVRDEWRTGGELELERADVSWFMSADPADLPFEPKPGQKMTFRSITVDGDEVDFSEGFTQLHTASYEAILAGRGFGIGDVRPSIELAHRVREQEVSPGSVAAIKHLKNVPRVTG
jgi:UDP-N-acetyl-2-amino-2-deoxyglucuronate dehydrogenase